MSNDDKYISWSQFRLWRSCPHKHWLIYKQDEPRDPPSKWTDFGSSIHETAEEWMGLIKEGVEPDWDPETRFVENFIKIAKTNHDEGVYNEFGRFKGNDVAEFGKAGKEIITELFVFLNEFFFSNGWKVFDVEMDLFEPLTDDPTLSDWKFKGFIDLVLTKGDEFYLMDYKTCSWGWGKDKLTDPLTMGQLHAYKHFFAKKMGITSLSKIKLGYILLKRTGKTGARVGMIKTSAGEKTLVKVVKELENMVKTVDRDIHKKTGAINGTCTDYGGCKFANTNLCDQVYKFGNKQ